MGVYIKGMKMPTGCDDCEFCKRAISGYDWCCVPMTNGRDKPLDEPVIKPDWCPLVPVPKHGRLVDADVLTELCRDIQSIEWNKHTAPYSWEYAYEDFENVILNAPTIIPPEETNKEATNDQNNS